MNTARTLGVDAPVAQTRPMRAAHRLRSPGHRLVAGTAPALLLLTLTGCTGGTAPAGAGAASTPGTPAGPATTQAPAPSGATAGAGGGSGAPAPQPTSTSPSSAGPTRCTSAHLSATLTQGGGGAAGSTLPFLVLTNTGTVSCTLDGWPGVSFVGDGNGTQLGAAGDRDDSSPHGPVTLTPGGAAHAPLRIANARNYDASACDPVHADGLRIYPPGETAALLVTATGLTACRSQAQHLISVQALQPGVS